MDKKTLRKQVLEIRDALTDTQIQEKSKIILEKLSSTKKFKESKNIMMFVSYSSEVYTHKFIENCINSGKNILIPYVSDSKNSIMKATVIKSMSDLTQGYKGILELKQERIEEFEPEQIDLIVTPCVCFDYKRYRVGYGKGFYDRFLGKTKAYKIGICFDHCIVEEIEIDQYDVAADMVITEKRVFI